MSISQSNDNFAKYSIVQSIHNEYIEGHGNSVTESKIFDNNDFSSVVGDTMNYITTDIKVPLITITEADNLINCNEGEDKK